MSPANWIDRKFDFEFEVGLYPEIIARLKRTPARLEEAVAGLSREQLRAKPDGKWSIQENAGHLLDEEKLLAIRVHEFLSGAEALTAASYKEKYLAYNDWKIEQVLREFRASRERQVVRLQSLSPNDFARTAMHPRLKIRIRLVDHVLFFAEHDDHHLARIGELRKLIEAVHQQNQV